MSARVHYTLEQMYEIEKNMLGQASAASGPRSVTVESARGSAGTEYDDRRRDPRYAGANARDAQRGPPYGPRGNRHSRDHETFEIGMKYEADQRGMDEKPGAGANMFSTNFAETITPPQPVVPPRPAAPVNEVDAMFMGDFDDIASGDMMLPTIGSGGQSSGNSTILQMLTKQPVQSPSPTSAPPPSNPSPVHTQKPQPQPATTTTTNATSRSNHAAGSAATSASAPVDASVLEQQMMRRGPQTSGANANNYNANGNGAAQGGGAAAGTNLHNSSKSGGFDVTSLQGLLKK